MHSSVPFWGSYTVTRLCFPVPSLHEFAKESHIFEQPPRIRQGQLRLGCLCLHVGLSSTSSINTDEHAWNVVEYIPSNHSHLQIHEEQYPKVSACGVRQHPRGSWALTHNTCNNVLFCTGVALVQVHPLVLWMQSHVTFGSECHGSVDSRWDIKCQNQVLSFDMSWQGCQDHYSRAESTCSRLHDWEDNGEEYGDEFLKFLLVLFAKFGTLMTSLHEENSHWLVCEVDLASLFWYEL